MILIFQLLGLVEQLFFFFWNEVAKNSHATELIAIRETDTCGH